jgi:hypothetical protein
MECLPVTSVPEGPEWTYEIKLDGYRLEAVKTGGKVTALFETAQRPQRQISPVASFHPTRRQLVGVIHILILIVRIDTETTDCHVLRWRLKLWRLNRRPSG